MPASHMSSISSSISRGVTSRLDRISIAPTQPLPIVVPGAARPFVVARAGVGARSLPVARPKVERFAFPLWLCVFALLNLGDLLSTYAGLHGGMREGNPLVGRMMAQYGFASLVAYKAFVVLAVTFGVLWLRSMHPSVARVTLSICNTLVAIVVLLNVVQFVVR